MTKRRPIDYNDAEWFSDGINMIDCDNLLPLHFMTDDMSSKDAMIKGVSDFMDYMCCGTKVTDMTFSIFAQTSSVDCETMGWSYRNSEKVIDKWLSPDNPYPREKVQRYVKYTHLYHALEDFGIDWAQVAVDEGRKRGVRPWVYFRMNDLHGVDIDFSLHHDPFFFKARENDWLNGNTVYGRPRGTSGKIENLYEFSHPEVREWMLTYIEEMMMRYDVFGFGFDFMRNIYCIDYLRAEPGYQKYMTEFMRGVKDIRRRAEQKHGHEIKIMSRLTHTVSDNFVYGFDVKEWMDEKLVDMLVAGCEEVCNSNLDVSEWREVIGDLPFLVGYDDHICRWSCSEAEHFYRVKPEHIKAYTAKYYNLGVNGIYSNNFYNPLQVHFVKDIDREAANEGLRTFVVTHQDITPIGCTPYKPLPIALSAADNAVPFDINIGTVKKGEFLYMTVGYDSDDGKDVSVTLAGHSPVSVTERQTVYNEITGHYYYEEEYDIRKSKLLLRYAFEDVYGEDGFTVLFDGHGSECNIVYIELSATPEAI